MTDHWYVKEELLECVFTGTCFTYTIPGAAEAELQNKCRWMGTQQ
jgi:hypothetical protein